MFSDGAHHCAMTPTTFAALPIGPGGHGSWFAFPHSQIKMAQNQQWTWFVLSLILNFFGFFWSIFPSLIWSFFPDVAAPLPAGSPPGNL